MKEHYQMLKRRSDLTPGEAENKLEERTESVLERGANLPDVENFIEDNPAT